MLYLVRSELNAEKRGQTYASMGQLSRTRLPSIGMPDREASYGRDFSTADLRTGHLANIEEPETFNRVLEDHLMRAAARPEPALRR